MSRQPPPSAPAPAQGRPPRVFEAGVQPDPWTALRRHTAARIALGRSGASLPTRELLAFGLAHAQARDAVHTPLDVAALRARLEHDGWNTIVVASRARDRAAYLARPDWGRRLTADSVEALRARGGDCDLVFVIGDGLSSSAVQNHAPPLLRALRPLLGDLRCADVVIATQARVALADEVGETLGARLAVMLIGERPGLSSPDSLGAYITYDPRIGRTDEARNCVSNIRPQGLAYEQAALLIAAIVRAALQARLSGVALAFDPARALQNSA